MNKAINLKQGLGDILFGYTIEQTMNIIGKPDEVEEIGSDVDCPTELLHYNKLGFSLFFSMEDEKLDCIDIVSKDVTLFGEKIMNKQSKDITNLMIKNDIVNQTMENEAWGEKRISFPDYSIDFFFVNDKLGSITIGR
ncbi:MAG: hypothetical protein LKE30_06275 [Bacteroidales bacterium]|jgi:hypothetical protein|nr:hypothetical protein [Bacteroidales bacterium]